MKQLTQYITEKFKLNSKNTKNIHKYNYHPETRDELKELVKKLIKERGDNANLNDIDTSNITDMSYIFKNSSFNGDISGWDVSNVTDMEKMFMCCFRFSGDISGWDVSNVTNMESMFFQCFKFNPKSLENWNISKVENYKNIFFDILGRRPSWYK